MAKDTNGIAIGSDQLATSAASNNRTVLYSKATGHGIYYDNNLSVSSSLPQHCYKSPIVSGTYENMQSVKYSDLQHYAYVEDIEPLVMFVDDFYWDDIETQLQDWRYNGFEEAREIYTGDPYGMGCNPYVFDPIRYPNDSIFEWRGSRYYLWHYIGYDNGAPDTLLTTVCDYDTLYSKSMEYITDVTTLKNTWPYIIKFQENGPEYGPTEEWHDCIVKVYKPYEYLNFYRKDNADATINLTNLNLNRPNVMVSEDYGLTWTSWDGSSRNLPVYTNPRLLVSGNNTNGFNLSNSKYSRFQFTGTVYAAGNIMSLLSSDYRTFTTNQTIPTNYCFCNLFRNSSIKSAPKLPATALRNYCYHRMFYACTGLTKTPILPATGLMSYCYYQMFYGCTGITEITCLATSDINVFNSTTAWVKKINGNGTFYKAQNASWSIGDNGCPKSFTQVEYSSTIST